MEPDWQTDKLLVSRLQTDDESAFKEIYDQFRPRIFANAVLKTHSREESEEIVQDLFLKLWLNRTKLNLRGPLENYLLASLRYKLINFYKAKRLQGRRRAAVTAPPEPGCNFTEQAIHLSEIRVLVQKNLDHLPNKSSQVFILSRFKHLSNKQIGRHLHITEKAVEYHISKSIKFLRLLLKDYT